VSTQPARYFRRRQSDLIVDAAWNRPEGDVRTAAAVAVECEVVTAVLAGAEAGGFTVTAIKPSENFLPASLSLFPPAEERRRQRRRWMTVLRAALLVLAVWCAAAGVYAVDLAHDRDAIAAEVRRLAEPIAELAAAREEMRAVSVMVEAVTRAAAAQGWATELLASLTETIPESAYVLELSVDLHGAGRIEGFADSARDVVDAIASIDGVSSIESLVNPRLLSSDPLAGGLLPDDGKERFTVVFGPPFPNDTVSMARAFAGDTTVGRITP
jgi:Tfp pilus assembly protein PilN